MTEITNRTTQLTANNLKRGFDLLTANMTEHPKGFESLCNIQKFESLSKTDNDFKTMLETEEQLNEFKNSLLKLVNHCSKNKRHEEIKLHVVTDPKHRFWIRELS